MLTDVVKSKPFSKRGIPTSQGQRATRKVAAAAAAPSCWPADQESGNGPELKELCTCSSFQVETWLAGSEAFHMETLDTCMFHALLTTWHILQL